jgi:hypothetical protein
MDELRITRRMFLHKSLLTAGVTAGAATYGWFPLINTIDLAWGQTAFKFAWISDTHLYPRSVNTRFVDKAVRAMKEVQAMNPPADFMIFGAIWPSSAIRSSSTSATTSSRR